jgi:lipid II:glycine glycyltransferase (peptidoglycan interpeptide bridge formation enzyme)
LAIDFKIINPLEFDSWNDEVVSTKDYCLFHSAEWANVLSQSYRYKPLYFAQFENKKIINLIPVMEISSLLTGKRGVSLPFSDTCEPILKDSKQAQDLLSFIMEYGKKSGWKYLEFRGSYNNLIPHQAFIQYYQHQIDLSTGEQAVFHRFRNSNIRNIKKAEKSGVQIEFQNSIKGLKTYYRLHCLTRKKLGAPPQPFYFFENFFQHIILNKLGFIILAFYNNKAIAGIITMHFGKKAIYKFGASDISYQKFRANNLLMSEAIKWYCQKGYESFHFGRTDRDNEGLRQFKSGWGAKEEMLSYFKFDLERNKIVTTESNTLQKFSTLFSIIPIPVSKMIGNVFYKHVG